MKVLIVAKTRQGSRACIGGITSEGLSVRLKAADYERNESAGLEYEVGEVWEVEAAPAPSVIPPHVENIIVYSKRKLGFAHDMIGAIERYMPPVCGGPGSLFDGLAQATDAGSLYIAERIGLPVRSTMFWRPDQPLEREADGRRIRYRYATADGGRTLVYVGFPDSLPFIPAGTLLRVSLAHWWRPEDSHEELRCYVQLSGWFGLPEHTFDRLKADSEQSSASLAPSQAQHPERSRASLVPSQAEHPERSSASLCTAQSKDAAIPPYAAVTAPPPRPDLSRARDLLKSAFGYDDFLPLQADIIANVLAGHDSLAVMPTGSGKSLCYQLPALLWNGLTLVISPLISLMQDQVAQLGALGIPAACLNGAVEYRETTRVMRQARCGEIKLLYTSPETLLRPETLLMLDDAGITCMAIDEAHCISEWGHDFRPEYRRLLPVRRRYPAAVCIALTATATRRVQDDIVAQLNIARPDVFIASFNRPNLYLEVEPRTAGLAQVTRFLAAHRGQSGIIYCGTRRKVDQLTTLLARQDWPALPYHAGMEDAQRRRNQEDFSHDRVPLIVATIAFGMGINKSNVRFVLHYNLPDSIESYYQEIGRAGRDGLRADCLLLYSRSDQFTIRKLIDEGAESERRGRHARLTAMLDYAEAQRCRRRLLLDYLGEGTSVEPCGFCDVCLAGSEADAESREDVSADARTLLSAIHATGEMFGPAYLADLLRGSRSGKLTARGHEQLPQHGSGRHRSAAYWRQLADRLVSRGVLVRDAKFGGLQLTDAGRAVLDGAALSLPILRARKAAPEEKTAYDAALFEKLRVLRGELADAGQVAAYMIFSDRTLAELATRCPRTESGLLQIHGIGDKKLRRYGQRVLAEICGHFGEPPPVLAFAPEAAQPNPQPGEAAVNGRSVEVSRLFIAGHSLADLMAAYGVRAATIVGHLEKCVQAGWRLPPERVLAMSQLSPEDRQAVLDQFAGSDHLWLSPVFEALGGKVSFDELHILRLYRLCGP